MSSKYSYPVDTDASNCIDNDLNSHFFGGSCCHTDRDSNSWLKIDLGAVKKVESVIVTGRSDWENEQSKKIDIKVSKTDDLSEAVICASNQDFYQQTQKEVNCVTDNIKGQYVWFLHEDWMVLCETEIFGTAVSTTAAPKLVPVGASMSSKYSYPVDTDASNCIDNDLNSHFFGGSCCHTDRDSNSWLKIDLGAVKKVESVIVTGRSDWENEQSKKIDIKVSKTDDLSEAVICASNQDFYQQTQKEVNCESNGIKGQYVWFLHEDWMVLCETEIFGTAVFTTSPSSAPSTLFNAQNFSVSEPNVLFHDSGSDFFLNFTFVTGDSSDETSYTLYKENCTNTEDVLDILNIVHETKEEVDVLVDKKAIEDSSLVTQSAGLGYSKGIIKFCIKTEAMISTMSVAFRKTNVKISYDLTENSFEVIDNTISANDISEEEIKVSTAYGVEACICKENLQCETSQGDKVFEQNGMIFICVYPNSTSAFSTEISNFDMKFEQGQQTTHTAVRITDEGPFATAGLSYIGGNEDRYLVASRLITALFEGGKDSFDVVGNALLQFKTRRLKKVQDSNLRSMQENAIGTDAGESQFKMNIKTAKADGKVSSTNSDSTNGVMVTVVGGLVTLSIMLVLFKKMKK